MNTYQPPCYTIEDTCSMLAITKTEFKHAVQMEQIKPVLYIAGKQMLIFTPETRHEWVGHAVVKYRGHYSAHKTVISALLDGEERNIGQGWGRILDQAGIEQISHKYPFQTPRPFGTLVDWRILDEKTEHIYQKSATPLPNEGDTLLGVLNSFANKLNCEALMRLCASRTCDRIYNCTVHEAREFLGFKCDYTPEEEAEVLKKHPWPHKQ